MNFKHIRILIQVMEETNPALFQAMLPQCDINGHKPLIAVHNLPELEHHKYRANFIGHIALHSYTQSLGCAPNVRGELIFGKEIGIPALMHFIGSNWHTARNLVCGDLYHKGSTVYSTYFDKPYEQVTPLDYIEKLRGLLALAPDGIAAPVKLRRDDEL